MASVIEPTAPTRQAPHGTRTRRREANHDASTLTHAVPDKFARATIINGLFANDAAAAHVRS